MSIAFGIVATDGIVIASDGEITSPGDLKGVDTKFVLATSTIEGRAPDSFFVAGAGSLEYFQALRLKVPALVVASLVNGKPVDEELEKFMVTFHRKHVTPYSNFPDPPSISLLVGTWSQGRGNIWATSFATVRPQVFGYEAIGIGASYVLHLLHGYFENVALWPVDSACLLASYAILRTKAVVQGCGQDTHMAVISDTTAIHLPRSLLLDCERAFDSSYHQFLSQAFYFSAGVSDHLPPEYLTETRRVLDGLRQRIRDTISASSQI